LFKVGGKIIFPEEAPGREIKQRGEISGNLKTQGRNLGSVAVLL
jgi:hypothetical protein